MKNKNQILYFITGNIHKFNEISKIFIEEKVKFQLKNSPLKTVEIQSNNNRDIAEYKLKSVKDEIKGSFLIEDAGFYVDEPLKGFPGVYSSYVFKTIGNEGIIKLIDDFRNTKAHFSAIIALYHKASDKIYFFEGRVDGKISEKIRGKKGFGFDPIFIPDEAPDKTFGEMSIEEKNKISHRGIALKKLIDFLKKL